MSPSESQAGGIQGRLVMPEPLSSPELALRPPERNAPNQSYCSPEPRAVDGHLLPMTSVDFPAHANASIRRVVRHQCLVATYSINDLRRTMAAKKCSEEL